MSAGNWLYADGIVIATAYLPEFLSK